MTTVMTEHRINAPLPKVWAAIADVATHVEWMQDAVSIRFLSDQRSGVGTEFDCDTKIGPLKVTDRIRITSWDEEKSMSVRHSGAVTGEGSFFVEAVSDTVTNVAWVETLHFPWFLAGPVGEMVAKPIFDRIWSGNLRRLQSRIEDSSNDAT